MRLLLISIFVIGFSSCFDHSPRVGPIGPERDIFLINIENGDREFIAKILDKIDSIGPMVIGIEPYFKTIGNSKKDSILSASLKRLSGDILSYGIIDSNNEQHSIPIFSKAVDDEGYLSLEETSGLVKNMTPILEINGKIHESFALKIVERWKPSFKHTFTSNKSLPIVYTRTLNSFLHIYGSDLISLPLSEFDVANLKKSIFLVGYSGPDNENMYRTPLRFVGADTIQQDQPDTYGIVIIANQIRTILDIINQE
jgi:hypothetical protein